MTMSDLFALMEGGGRFRSDPRFSAFIAEAAPEIEPDDEPDALAMAYATGFAAGAAETRAEMEAAAQSDADARGKLELTLYRLDAEMAEALHQRLIDTVACLCEQAIAPLALDREALALRVERAVAMLARADDERVIRLHPDDIALLSDHLRAEWEVRPDPALERGSLRVECASGGVEDGPAQWRRAIAEALDEC